MKERLFVDTNYFLYFLTKHEKWRKIADIFDNKNYELATNVMVLNELKYKLLWISASKKLNTTDKYKIISCIKTDKKLREEAYSKFLEFYIHLKSRFTILDISDKEEIHSCTLSNKYGLLPTDASIVANMTANGFKKILTDDSDFVNVGLVEVFRL